MLKIVQRQLGLQDCAALKLKNRDPKVPVLSWLVARIKL